MAVIVPMGFGVDWMARISSMVLKTRRPWMVPKGAGSRPAFGRGGGGFGAPPSSSLE
ncbi:hypothetical protein KSP40_PGU001509 [Platanthera guangdongensis]|uniref:Uncharacterized protein n=1 Tax=Platanthera guangdongensis TaxID=2320717 RepID=A0ABR2M534_9ASPA